MRLQSTLLATSVSLLVLTPAAFATPVTLAPGGTVTAFTPSTSAFAGTQVGTYTMSFSNAFENGSVLEDVYNNNGLLDFYYRVTNSSTSSDSLSRVTVGNYAGFTTSVDYLENGGDAPTSATRQASGDSVGFYDMIDPGTSSDFLEVATNATAFTPTGTIAIIDSVSTNFVGALNPSAVPEPSALALFGAGLLAIGVAARRKLFSL